MVELPLIMLEVCPTTGLKALVQTRFPTPCCRLPGRQENRLIDVLPPTPAVSTSVRPASTLAHECSTSSATAKGRKTIAVIEVECTETASGTS
jgi:hypothetical protein